MNIENYINRFSKIFSEEILNFFKKNRNISKLNEAIIYCIKVGGKRLRPLLVMEISKLLDVEKKYSIRVASSIELIHCYSLVHDDLPSMDNDDLRRGNPTCHVKYNEATAILVGDAMQSLAFQVLSDKKTFPDPDVRCKLVNELSMSSGLHGMVEGQMQDLEAEKKKLNLKQIKELQNFKTGKLFHFSCIAGVIMSKKDKEFYNLFSKFAYNLGLAFQIKDDLLDLEGDQKRLGKKTQKDEIMGKETFISLMGAEKSKKYAKQLVEESIELISCFGKRKIVLEKICQMIIDRSN